MTITDLHGYILFGLFGIFTGYGEGLKNVKISVPSAIRSDETAVLMCTFDLEGQMLYSVKWYKEHSEIFRYTPKDEFPVKTFPVKDLEVDRNKSNMTTLTIRRVKPSSTGTYNCEISTEQTFQTELLSGYMQVVDVPDHGPIIGIDKRVYNIGDSLEANCTTGKSFPPANLTWYINGKPADSNQVVIIRIEDSSINKIEHNSSDYNPVSSMSGIQFLVKSHDFDDGHLWLRCTARIYNVYRKEDEIDIHEANRQVMHNNIEVMPSNPLKGGSESSSSINSTHSILSISTIIILLILILR